MQLGVLLCVLMYVSLAKIYLLAIKNLRIHKIDQFDLDLFVAVPAIDSKGADNVYCII